MNETLHNMGQYGSVLLANGDYGWWAKLTTPALHGARLDVTSDRLPSPEEAVADLAVKVQALVARTTTLKIEVQTRG